MSDGEPVRLVLTAEQREVIHRVSGKHVDAIEINPDDDQSEGGHLRFLWRRAERTGVPQLQWMHEDEERPPQATT